MFSPSSLFTALCLGLLMLLSACSSPPPPGLLLDADVIPVGSRVEFWIHEDDKGWQQSNIHIVSLPRPMTGAEARRWAEEVGRRDAAMHWTQYYVLVTHPGPAARTYRSAVATYERRARLQTPQ